MGFDKPDLGFVVHLGAPASPIAYYQQVGRAGRGVERAEVVLLPGGQEDEAIWKYFASLGFPREEQVRQVLAVLGGAGGPMSTAPSSRTSTCAAPGSRRCSRCSTSTARCGASAAAGPRPASRGTTTPSGTPRVAAERSAEQQTMRDYAATSDCRMLFLRRQLDDPAFAAGTAQPCGPVRPVHRPAAAAEVSAEALDAARAALGKPGVEVEPRRMWPTGMSAAGIDLSGKIPAALQAETGRALGRLSDVGWGTRLRPLLTGPDGLPADADLPDDVLRAVVDVLAGWGWATRPTGVVAVPSRTRPRLVGSLAARLAEVGRLPLLGTLERVRDEPPGTGLSNSAQRLRAVHGALAVPAGLALDGSPVLLVDDVVSTGWTLTEASRLLREAGAGPVLPLVLAVDG
jgi:ATP-dependent DNA helicase RecQ